MPPKQGRDERLLIEAAKEDPARFAELYEENFERVYAFVSRRAGNRDEAQDLTAEVFHQALANLPGFEWRGLPFAAWLYRIAANAIADRWKRAARERGNPAPKDPPSPDDAIDAERIERRAQIFRLVRILPADQRRVIEMRFAEEKSIGEIARELKRTPGAVKQLQFRGIQYLRAQLDGRLDKKPSGSNG
ncbi:MAG TPA: RNA polymerase sigma factor [Candidatus Acidoferrales bacterium]|nr:RNA polymerase sigma factor [Candidatus Acidoferrales bacterium]